MSEIAYPSKYIDHKICSIELSNTPVSDEENVKNLNLNFSFAYNYNENQIKGDPAIVNMIMLVNIYLPESNGDSQFFTAKMECIGTFDFDLKLSNEMERRANLSYAIQYLYNIIKNKLQPLFAETFFDDIEFPDLNTDAIIDECRLEFDETED